MGPKTTQTNRGVDWYQFFARVIDDRGEEPDDYIPIINRRTESDLKPKDKKSRPLLALARSNKKWFRYLIEKCDPNVTWMEGKTKMKLEEVLQRQWNEEPGREIYNLYLDKKEEREQRRTVIPAENRRKKEEEDPSEGTNYLGVALKMGVLAAGASAVFTMSTAVGGVLPLSAVGFAVWEAVKKLDNAFDASAPTDELQKVFDESMTVLGRIFELMDGRIEAAETATRRSDDPELRRRYEEEKGRVDTLAVMLEHSAKDLDSIKKSKDSAAEKMEKMRKMLNELHAHRQELVVQGTLDSIKVCGESMREALTKALTSRSDTIEQTGVSPQQNPTNGGVEESKKGTSSPGYDSETEEPMREEGGRLRNTGSTEKSNG